MRASLPAAARRLIASSIPTLDALEILLTMVRHPDEAWSAAAVRDRLRLSRLPEEGVAGYLALLAKQGLAVEEPPHCFHFRAASPELAEAVDAVVTAYDRQPVTLIRTIYEIADGRSLQAFADAFRLKKED